MPGARRNRLHRRLLQPFFDKSRSLFDRKRIGEYARSSCDSQEGQETNPWQSHVLAAGESLLEPLSRSLVVGASRLMA